MFTLLRPAMVLFLLMTLLTGAIYPAIVTAIAKVALYRHVEGSVVSVQGRQVGSELIAQPFTDAKYFWPRPSAANYDATASAGSNLGPSNPALADAIKGRVDALRAADPGNTTAVPIELVTASASGLDPHLSPAAARYQASRIARVRHLPVDDVNRLIDTATEPLLLGVLGDAKVNVLRLNLALDHPQPASMPFRDGKASGFLPEAQ